MDQSELDENLHHKDPFHPHLEDNGPPIAIANLDFNLESLLQYSDFQETSPPGTPTNAFDVDSEFDTELVASLFSLSPLSSASSSPTSSPRSNSIRATEFDDADSSTLPPLDLGNTASPPSRFTKMKQLNEVVDLASKPTPQDDERESEAPPPLAHSHKARRRTKNHQNRQTKRTQQREGLFSPYGRRPDIEKNHVDTATSIKTPITIEKSNAAKNAYVALNDVPRKHRKKRSLLKDLVGEGSEDFSYVGWDGRSRRSVTDAGGRKVAFLAGQPDEEDWPRLMQEAADALESRRPRLSIPKEEAVHRRGAFPAIRCGVSHGGGSTSPGNLKNLELNDQVVGELVSMPCFKRLAGFASSVMASQAPKLYQYYVENLSELHKNHPELKRLFCSSVFAAASFNFGPQTACFPHKDFANLPFGLCSVTSFGSFNSKEGGHLILWDLRLVIEFPAGSTILFPSAIIAHSNVPIKKGETRYSFAQYTAGGLFRWVQNGCKLTAPYYASLSPEELELARERDAQRWKYGLSLFETIDA